ncbi:MAG TPA: hypothetical protein VFI96_04300 [Longimicrobiaceae bacterium]|nr:hypothetical protein [Longimicrobiaceae bacterium]
MTTNARYWVHRLDAEGAWERVHDEDGDPYYLVGMAAQIVREAAEEVADRLAYAEPDHRFAVLDAAGVVQYEATCVPPF